MVNQQQAKREEALSGAQESNHSVNQANAADMFSEPDELEKRLFEPIKDNTGGQLKPFLNEYKKLQEALVKSHESEQRFVTKCRDLAASIRECRDNAASYDAAQEENRRQKEVLEREIELVKSSKEKLDEDMAEREREAEALRLELADLNRKMDTFAQVLFQEQEQIVGGLERELDEATMKRDHERGVLSALRKDNAALSAKVELFQIQKEKETSEISELSERIQEIDASVSKKNLEKEALETQMKELKNICTERSLEIGRKAERIRKSRQELTQEREALKDAMKTATTSSSRLARLNEDAQELEDSFQEQQESTEDVAMAIASLEKAIADDENTKAAVEQELNKRRTALRKLQGRVGRAEQELGEMNARRASLVSQLKQRKLEVSTASAAAAVTSRAMEVASREREVLSHDHAAKLDNVAALRIALTVAENSSSNMENELRAFNTAVKGWKTLIEQLVQDTDALKDELQHKEERTQRARERSAAKELQILSLQKAIMDQETRRRQQQNLLESVRSDRNMYSKTLLEQKHEMAEFRRVFESLSHTIVHVQQELNDKESAFVSEHLRVEQVDEEISSIEQQTRAVEKRLGETQERVKAQGAQVSKLTSIINEADEELQAQTKQYNAVVNEERVLVGQLVARNEELAQLYEHLRLQNSKMKKGEEHYRVRRQQYMEVVQTRQRLAQELEAIDFDREEIEKYRKAINDMDKLLLEKRLQVRALQDELKKPMNVHRWRRLQDTNAETYTMIRQVQELQKSIISKSSTLNEKDAKIQQKESLYVDLRRILARQPGQEAREQLRIYEAALKDKKAKHRAMQAELKMHQAKVYELKYEIEKVYKALDLTKVAYFQRRRSEARAIAAAKRDSVAGLKQEQGRISADSAEQDFGEVSGDEVPMTPSKTELSQPGDDRLSPV